MNSTTVSGKMRLQPKVKQNLKEVYFILSSSVLFFVLCLITLIYFADSKSAFAASNGDYRSKATGNWNAVGTWETYSGGAWINAAATPTSTAGVITIQSPHTVTVTASVNANELVVDAGATVIINNGKSLTLPNGTGNDLTVNGTITIFGILNCQANSHTELTGTITLKNGATGTFGGAATININSGGRYVAEDATLTTSSNHWTVQSGGVFQHNVDGGSLPSATWVAGSLCEVTGVVSTQPNSLNQTFQNFKWNCPNQTSVENLSGNLTAVNGDFTFVSTGTGSVRLGEPENYTFTIGGNFYMQGGNLFETASGTTTKINLTGDYNQTGGSFAGTDATKSSGIGTPTLNVTGNFIISGGTFDCNQYTSNTAGKGITTINLSGNFSQSGGTVTETATQTGKGDVYFKKAGTQTFTKSAGTISNTVDFSVNSGAVLDMSTYIIDGGGAFNLKSGGGIILASLNGITANAASGNIQVTGTRTYNTGADYTYNGAGAQSTGDGLPATVNKLTINNSSDVTLTTSTSVSNTLTLTAGNILAAADTLTIGTSTATLGTLVRTSGVIVGNLKRWFAAATSSNVFFPLGTGGFDESINIGFTVAPTIGGTITGNYSTTDPGKNGFNLWDAPDSLTNVGYGLWQSTPGNGLTGGTYSIDIIATALPNVTDYTKLHMVRRTNAGAAWTVVGSHSAGTGSNAVPVVHRSGMTVHGQFGIGSNVVNPLPIELMYFHAKLDNNVVKLSWATASEINNDYFIVERSSDGVKFEELLKKHGAGNSTNKIYYSDEDKEPLNGYSYYRLKQIDFDGHCTYSSIENVDYSTKPGDGSDLEIISISPNPFTESFNLNFSSKLAINIEILVINSSGQTIIKDNVQTVEGFNVYQFSNKYNLTSGIYFVYLIFEDQKVVKRIVKD